MFLIFLNQNQLIHFFIKTNFIKASIQFYLYSFSKAKIQMIFQQETNKKQSPFKTKSFQKLEPSKQDIVKRLLYVFTYYAGKVSKYNYRQMQQKYFMELMSDVWVIAGKETDFERNSLTWRNIQNVYYSKGRKQLLDFNQFLEILPTISIYFQTQITRQQAVKAFIYFLNAIYENVVLKELQSWRIIAQSDYISQDTRAFIMKLSPDFTKIYKIYFPEQMNNKFKEKDYYYKSFQTYLQVMKQFEIYPKLISASQLFFIFHSSIQSFSHSLITQSEQSRQTVQQLGQVFKLSKFIQAFIPVSRVALSKLKQIDDPQMQQWAHKQKQTLKILLQYMETIKSVKNKKCKYSQSRFSFIIYQQYPEEHTMKKFLIKDKIIKQPQNKLSFYELFDKMKI